MVLLKKVIWLCVALISQPTFSSSITGEYHGEPDGLLRVEDGPLSNSFVVWLGVGSGSCGGETHIDNKEIRLRDNRLVFNWKLKNRSCTTVIIFENETAKVMDNCITPESEAGSTCALMGNYIKVNEKKTSEQESNNLSSTSGYSQGAYAIEGEYSGAGEGNLSLRTIVLDNDAGIVASSIFTGIPGGCSGSISGIGKYTNRVLRFKSFTKAN